MRTIVRKVGNSSGLVIPKPLLAEIGVAIGDVFEVTAEEGRIVLAPVSRRTRAGWAEASRQIASADDDVPVWPEFGNADDADLVW